MTFPPPHMCPLSSFAQKKLCSPHPRFSAGNWFFLGLRCGYCTLGSQDLSTCSSDFTLNPNFSWQPTNKREFFSLNHYFPIFFLRSNLPPGEHPESAMACGGSRKPSCLFPSSSGGFLGAAKQTLGLCCASWGR